MLRETWGTDDLQETLQREVGQSGPFGPGEQPLRGVSWEEQVVGQEKVQPQGEEGLMIFYAWIWVRAEGRGRGKVGSLTERRRWGRSDGCGGATGEEQ